MLVLLQNWKEERQAKRHAHNCVVKSFPLFFDTLQVCTHSTHPTLFTCYTLLSSLSILNLSSALYAILNLSTTYQIDTYTKVASNTVPCLFTYTSHGTAWIHRHPAPLDNMCELEGLEEVYLFCCLHLSSTATCWIKVHLLLLLLEWASGCFGPVWGVFWFHAWCQKSLSSRSWVGGQVWVKNRQIRGYR